MMPNDSDRQAHQALIDRLMRETGVTEEKARELVALIGANWPSLVFQAKMSTRKR